VILLGFVFLSCAYRGARTKKEKKEKKERGEGRKPWEKVERITRLVAEGESENTKNVAKLRIIIMRMQIAIDRKEKQKKHD